MKLIDGDKLKNEFEAWPWTDYTKDAVVKIIDSQPTAYDVDKVVEQLKQMKARYFLTIANTGNEILDKIYEEVGNSIDKAIVIVKGGGQGE